jgi:glycosyltransferase involved in cell wall biosynthesis
VIPPVSPNFPQFQPAPALERDRHEGLNLLVLGRVVPHKRLEDAIQVLALLRQHGVAATLNIVGSSGNRVYQDHLDQLVRSLGLSASVHFKGLVDAPALLSAYSESDALLLTSEHEGFGVPVLEAMHRGLPVVMRKGTAASEVGADAVQNFASIEQAADQLQRLAQEPGLQGAMVKSGRRRAAELLEQASAGAWQKLLQEVDAQSGISC